VRLLRVDDGVLQGLLTTAIADADPAEVMTPGGGPPGWTAQCQEAFRVFRRARRDDLADPPGEVTFAVAADGKIAGSARLGCKDHPAVLEAGLWLARSARGRGIGTVILHALADEAVKAGAVTVTAETTATNPAALAVLCCRGSLITVNEDSGRVHAGLRLAQLPPASTCGKTASSAGCAAGLAGSASAARGHDARLPRP
jgi:RimJ/RimL family protein N-acetyltransferase